MNAQRHFFSLFICLVGLFTFNQKAMAQVINITLQNNSVLPRQVIICVKNNPADTDSSYGTYKHFFLPYGTKTISVTVGTLVERMDEKDIPVLMNGAGNQTSGTLLVKPTAADAGKTFQIW
jgi:hypothetical protein